MKKPSSALILINPGFNVLQDQPWCNAQYIYMRMSQIILKRCMHAFVDFR